MLGVEAKGLGVRYQPVAPERISKLEGHYFLSCPSTFLAVRIQW